MTTDRRNMLVAMDVDIHRALKVIAVERDIPLKVLVEQALADWCLAEERGYHAQRPFPALAIRR